MEDNLAHLDPQVVGGWRPGASATGERQAILWLVGGDWNHGFLTDFPETVGNVIIPIIPIDEVHDFSEGLVETTNQMVIIESFWMILG